MLACLVPGPGRGRILQWAAFSAVQTRPASQASTAEGAWVLEFLLLDGTVRSSLGKLCASLAVRIAGKARHAPSIKISVPGEQRSRPKEAFRLQSCFFEGCCAAQGACERLPACWWDARALPSDLCLFAENSPGISTTIAGRLIK